MVREAKRRREVFVNILSYLNKFKEIINRIDPNRKVFLFGSTVRREYTSSSYIDILIVTEADPSIVIHLFRKRG